MEILQFGSFTEHAQTAFHAGGVAGKGADVGIAAGFLRRGEFKDLTLMGIQESRLEPDRRVAREKVVFHRLLRLFEHFHHQRLNVGAGRAEHHIVRHIVWVFEGQLDLCPRRHSQFGQVKPHLGSEGFEGDFHRFLRQQRGGRGGEETG